MSNFNFNKVILGGRLTAAPELKTTPGGVSVVQFTVAVNRKFGEKQADGTTKVLTDFIRVTAWRQVAEFVCRYFGKGSSVCVVGAIQTRTWTDKDGKKQYSTEVVADEVYFVDSKGDRDVEGAVPYQSTEQRTVGAGAFAGAKLLLDSPSASVPQFETIIGDDDLPF